MEARSQEVSRSSPLHEPEDIRRLQRLAVILGSISVLAAVLVGWFSYTVSREALVHGYYDDTLTITRKYVEILEGSNPRSLDREVLEALRGNFQDQPEQWPGAYLCVVDQHGRLVLHTGSPEKEGVVVGHWKFRGQDEEGWVPGNLLELIHTHRNWSGRYESLEGKLQMAAFAYVPSVNALVATHVPWDSVERRLNSATLPWALGFGLIVLLAGPFSLWGLSKAYAETDRAARRARESERRANEHLRTLREIDRAILGGGSVQEIAQAALARIRVLIPCIRASVALIDEPKQESRLLAVEGAARMSAGPDTVVSFSDIGQDVLDTLRAGRVHCTPDTHVRTSMKGFFDQLREEGIRSYLKAPLISRGALIGTLNVSFDHIGEPAAEEIELAGEVADVLAVAVVQAQLREELRVQAADLEQRVAERTRQLSEVNAELEGYVHSVSHDLRAPLRAVRGFGNLLIEEVGNRLQPTEREYLQRMVSASQRMEALMRDLLAYSRLAREEVDIRPLDLQLVVREAQDMLQGELEERRAVLDIGEPLLPVAGHHSTLVQAVANLLSNAAKFVAAGVQPRIRVRTEKRGDLVRLWVEDNGIGIAPEYHEKIFRVFERLNGVGAYPGTGIGLAIVRRAADRMGGATGVESRPGEGSRFWIDLPAAGGAV
ncbi:MAG: sensor histidine kinase [Planctomycetota bacterium]